MREVTEGKIGECVREGRGDCSVANKKKRLRGRHSLSRKYKPYRIGQCASYMYIVYNCYTVC